MKKLALPAALGFAVSLSLSSSASATNLEILGISDDGKRVAVEEYGYEPGMEGASDAWVGSIISIIERGQPSLRQLHFRAESRGKSANEGKLTDLRKEALDKASTGLQRSKIRRSNHAAPVELRMVGESQAYKFTHRNKKYQIELRSKVVPGKSEDAFCNLERERLRLTMGIAPEGGRAKERLLNDAKLFWDCPAGFRVKQAFVFGDTLISILEIGDPDQDQGMDAQMAIVGKIPD
jgi:hypothetical protein